MVFPDWACAAPEPPAFFGRPAAVGGPRTVNTKAKAKVRRARKAKNKQRRHMQRRGG